MAQAITRRHIAILAIGLVIYGVVLVLSGALPALWQRMLVAGVAGGVLGTSFILAQFSMHHSITRQQYAVIVLGTVLSAVVLGLHREFPLLWQRVLVGGVAGGALGITFILAPLRWK